jgi:hypothetical protein
VKKTLCTALIAALALGVAAGSAMADDEDDDKDRFEKTQHMLIFRWACQFGSDNRSAEQIDGVSTTLELTGGILDDSTMCRKAVRQIDDVGCQDRRSAMRDVIEKEADGDCEMADESPGSFRQTLRVVCGSKKESTVRKILISACEQVHTVEGTL